MNWRHETGPETSMVGDAEVEKSWLGHPDVIYRCLARIVYLYCSVILLPDRTVVRPPTKRRIQEVRKSDFKLDSGEALGETNSHKRTAKRVFIPSRFRQDRTVDGTPCPG